MWILKCLYTLNSASAVTMTFVTIFYYKELNLSKDFVGFVQSIIPFVSLFSIPILLYLIETNENWNMKNSMIGVSLAGICVWSLHLLAPFIDRGVGYLLCFIAVGTAMTFSSTGTLLDALTLQILENSNDYGKCRLYGSISWGVASLITGILINSTGNLSLMFYLFGALTIPFCVFAYSLNIEHHDPAREVLLNQSLDQDIDCGAEKISLSKSILKCDVLAFFATAILLGLVFNVIQTYLFLYLTITWNATPFILGLTTPFSVALEIPIFHHSNQIINIMKEKNMILFAHLLLIIRMSFYITLPLIPGTISTPALMLPIELLHGAAFALQWSAGMNYVKKMAPPGYESTFVGIFCSLSNNAGGIIGNIIGGYIYEVFGYQYLWGFGICLVASSATLFSLCH